MMTVILSIAGVLVAWAWHRYQTRCERMDAVQIKLNIAATLSVVKRIMSQNYAHDFTFTPRTAEAIKKAFPRFVFLQRTVLQRTVHGLSDNLEYWTIAHSLPYLIYHEQQR